MWTPPRVPLRVDDAAIPRPRPMKKTTVVAAVLALVGATALVVRWSKFRSENGARATPPAAAVSSATSHVTSQAAAPSDRSNAKRGAASGALAATPPETAAASPATPEEKAARVAKIKRDYDEIRAKASADYSAAGPAFPGGLNAFLRQLALLEREKRADFAQVLSPRELEELEMRESAAGNLVERLLGATTATPEQRRAVFQLQRAHEDRFALTFDLTPPALLEREAARQQTQEKIRAVLGDALFGAWLAGEGGDYALSVAFGVKNHLPPTAPLELWRAKNDYTLRRLELATQKLGADQQRAAQTALLQQAEARVIQIVGPSVLRDARTGVLGWLPRK